MNGPSHAAFLNLHSTQRAARSDQEIVSAAKARLHRDFAELHALYSRRLYKTIIAITRNPEDAEDALQETFMRAYLAIDTFEGRSSFYSWLTRIALNSALLILRKRRRRAEILFDPQPGSQEETFHLEVKDSAPDPEQAYGLRQRHVRLLSVIRSLGPGLREPLQMRLAKGASLKEIGRALNISEGAVKARLHRARAQVSALSGES